METSIYVTTDFEALHCWPNAPKEVEFLRHPHRHLFGVKLFVRVSHEDRDVEFFTLKKALEEIILLLKESLLTTVTMSCEQMASFLLWECVKRGRYSVKSVEVNEDGENGAIIER